LVKGKFLNRSKRRSKRGRTSLLNSLSFSGERSYKRRRHPSRGKRRSKRGSSKEKI